jgi:tetratricopeptide (TPR) repeat protein
MTRVPSALRPPLALLAAAALLACSAAKPSSTPGIRSDAATLEESSLEYALRGDLERARVIQERALVAYRSVDDTAAMAGALNRVGNLRQRSGDPDGARQAYAEAQNLARLTGDAAEEAAATSNLGTLAEEAGDLATADVLYRQAAALAQSAGADATRATVLNNQALLARRRGDPAAAIELLRAALDLDRAQGNEAGEANRLRNLGAVYAAVGRRAEALDALARALDIDRRRENVPEIALDLVLASEVHARETTGLGVAISQRRRAAEIHRLLDRQQAVAADETAIAGWCAALRAADPGAPGLVACAPGGSPATVAGDAEPAGS